MVYGYVDAFGDSGGDGRFPFGRDYHDPFVAEPVHSGGEGCG